MSNKFVTSHFKVRGGPWQSGVDFSIEPTEAATYWLLEPIKVFIGIGELIFSSLTESARPYRQVTQVGDMERSQAKLFEELIDSF